METIRDIAIIILAVESIITGIVLIVLAWQVYRLTKTIREELKPLIQDVDETVRVVKGTATYVSEKVVAPTIKVSKTVAFVRRAAQVIADLPFAGRTMDDGQ